MTKAEKRFATDANTYRFREKRNCIICRRGSALKYRGTK